MPVKLNSSGGGSVTLTTPSTATDYTATFPANTGNVVTTGSSGVVTQTMLSTNVAGNGPAFAAYLSGSNQTITNSTYTKVTLNAEYFDTANCFDISTNYRFTPNVAGYYQINAGARLTGTSPSTYVWAIYKNGSIYVENNVATNVSTYDARSVVGLVSMNGTTDYIELYVYIAASSGWTVLSGGNYTFMSGFLARSA